MNFLIYKENIIFFFINVIAEGYRCGSVAQQSINLEINECTIKINYIYGTSFIEGNGGKTPAMSWGLICRN